MLLAEKCTGRFERCDGTGKVPRYEVRARAGNGLIRRVEEINARGAYKNSPIHSLLFNDVINFQMALCIRFRRVLSQLSGSFEHVNNYIS